MVSLQFDDRTNPLDKHVELLADVQGLEPEPIAAQASLRRPCGPQTSCFRHSYLDIHSACKLEIV